MGWALRAWCGKFNYSLNKRQTSVASTVMASICTPEEREERHVHEVYSSIATHFSDTRYNPWPRVAGFLSSLPPGSLVADVGNKKLII